MRRLWLVLAFLLCASPVWAQNYQFVTVNGVPVVPIIQITQQARLADGTAAAPSLTFANETNSGFYRVTTNDIAISIAGTRYFEFLKSGGVGMLDLQTTGVLTFGTTTNLQADAANTLAQRNGTNAQAFNVYNTYTSSTDNELARILWAGNVLYFGTEKGSGGGSARQLNFMTGGTSRWVIDATTGALTGQTATALITSAGTTAVAPIVLTNGTNLSSATANAVENDGVRKYWTQNTTNGREIEDTWNWFRLTGSGTGITTIADFFGATGSGIPLVANGVYEIEWYCQFSQATAGTATWTIVTATTALANLTAEYVGSPVGGIGAVGAPQTAGINVTSSSSTAMPVTGTEADAATHRFIIRATLTAGNGASNVRLRLTMGAGTATPLINSYIKVRRVPAATTGTFVS